MALQGSQRCSGGVSTSQHVQTLIPPPGNPRTPRHLFLASCRTSCVPTLPPRPPAPSHPRQVSVHVGDVTECFECQEKPPPKTYPVCTLRNTPDKPIHCVVWAKEMLFPLLFGAPEASDLNEATTTTAVAAGGEEGDGKDAAPDDPSFYQRREGESSRQYAERVFRCRGSAVALAVCFVG